MRNTVDILGVPVDNVTMEQAVAILEHFIDEKGNHAVYTPNAEIMMAAQRDSKLKGILKKADLLVADGAGVVLSSKILGLNLPERVAGFDLVKALFAQANKRSIKIYLFGGKPGVAEEAGRVIENTYPGVKVAGCRDGYFTPEEEPGIISTINASEADILLVALGAPKQEAWIDLNMYRINTKICIGVGGSLDVFAGKVKRAPEFFQKNNLEWLYRLYKEPWRFRRMLDLPRFIILSIGAKFRLVK